MISSFGFFLSNKGLYTGKRAEVVFPKVEKMEDYEKIFACDAAVHEKMHANIFNMTIDGMLLYTALTIRGAFENDRKNIPDGLEEFIKKAMKGGCNSK